MSDLISRQAVLDLVEPDARPFLAERISNLPSADRQKGKWIYEIRSITDPDGVARCGRRVFVCSLCNGVNIKEAKYCSDCGAEMEREG